MSNPDKPLASYAPFAAYGTPAGYRAHQLRLARAAIRCARRWLDGTRTLYSPQRCLENAFGHLGMAVEYRDNARNAEVRLVEQKAREAARALELEAELAAADLPDLDD